MPGCLVDLRDPGVERAVSVRAVVDVVGLDDNGNGESGDCSPEDAILIQSTHTLSTSHDFRGCGLSHKRQGSFLWGCAFVMDRRSAGDVMCQGSQRPIFFVVLRYSAEQSWIIAIITILSTRSMCFRIFSVR
jgi:hypothetical protein